MNRAPLLVELFTEELPPKALERLGNAFASGIHAHLVRKGLADESAAITVFASPRRLGVRVSAARSVAEDRPYTEKLMPVSVGLDAQGQATPALLKKMAAKGIAADAVSQLARESDGKAEQLVWRGVAPGATLAQGLQEAIESAMAGLPIPKVMSYQLADGQTTVHFVRPAHRLIALHGDAVVPVSVLGLTADRVTGGHRFQGEERISVPDAMTYETLLLERGRVIASFAERRAHIEKQLRDHAASLGASLGDEADVVPLLDEVTALVEFPCVYVGAFEPEFLAVPPECLILTMRLNQKYFPLFAADGKRLTHQFLIVSNMTLEDPRNVIEGNQRVVRPRLADARFFYETDRRSTLASRLPQLESIVFHNKLGSQADRVRRLQALAGHVADSLGLDASLARRAAELAKADLVTNMVGEFPELQGLMGAYYAAADGEPEAVQRALRHQYALRLEGPIEADDGARLCLFMADRCDTLVSLWAAAGAPSGDKDPYGLRRAALGLLSAFDAMTASGLGGRLALATLIEQAIAQLPASVVSATLANEVSDFIFERLRQQLLTQHERALVEAVLALRPPLHEVERRIAALQAFSQLPEAEALAAANKRIGNLLRKVEGSLAPVRRDLLSEAAETVLADLVDAVEPQVVSALQAGDFTQALKVLAQVRPAVDGFFADVMVMADDTAVRNNRLALLGRLHGAMNQVADLARLAG